MHTLVKYIEGQIDSRHGLKLIQQTNALALRTAIREPRDEERYFDDQTLPLAVMKSRFSDCVMALVFTPLSRLDNR